MRVNEENGNFSKAQSQGDAYVADKLRKLSAAADRRHPALGGELKTRDGPGCDFKFGRISRKILTREIQVLFSTCSENEDNAVLFTIGRTVNISTLILVGVSRSCVGIAAA